MIPCMIESCSRQFLVVSNYLTHITEDHKAPTEYRFKCTVGQCRQNFSLFYPFKKHILNHRSSQSCNLQNETDSSNSFSAISVPEPKQQKIEILDQLPTAATEIKPSLETDSFNFTLNLHSKVNVTRKDVYSIQHDISQILSKIVSEIETFEIIFRNAQDEFSFKMLMSRIRSVFDGINSDHNVIKSVSTKVGLPLPEVVKIDKELEIKSMDFEFEEENVNSLIVMPITEQVKSFFESGDNLDIIINNTKKLEGTSSITNVVNGTKWTETKAKHGNYKYLVPVSLYADEFEVNDSQSSHSNRHSVCGFYYNFPTIPREQSSKLKNIFVAGMAKKVDIKDVGINKLLPVLIDKFKQLETEGVEISVGGKHVTLRCVLCLFQGDNLGIHTALSFATGFSSTFYCRFCRRPKELLKSDLKEHADCLRRRQDYDYDVEVNKLSETGVVENSIFNQLPSFHVTENKVADAMHDFFSSGICKYGFVEVLNHFIYIKKNLTVKQLNDRRLEVGKASTDSELLRMPNINESFNSKDKRKSIKLKMTSNEMRIFTHYFPLLIGQYIPLDDPVWKYVQSLIELVELSLSHAFTLEDIETLKQLIENHHSLYINLFEQELKPKHHFVVHYPSIIRASGPIHNMMCFRFEANHKGFKQYSHAIGSRKNICYTLCYKSYLKFANDVVNNNFFTSEFCNNFNNSNLRFRNYFKKIIQPINANCKFDVMTSSSIVHNGINYKTGNFVAINNLGNVSLFEIIESLSVDDNLYLIVQVWQVVGYDHHFLAYETSGCTEQVDILKIDLFTSPPFMVTIINDRILFRIRSFFVN